MTLIARLRRSLDIIRAQQALIDFLRAHVNARRDWCMASVALSRALGLPADGNLR